MTEPTLSKAINVAGGTKSLGGPTTFVNGLITSAAPVNTQVQVGNIKVIYPDRLGDAKPIFRVPA